VVVISLTCTYDCGIILPSTTLKFCTQKDGQKVICLSCGELFIPVSLRCAQSARDTYSNPELPGFGFL